MSEFLDRMKAAAKSNKKTIVLPEGEDPRTIEAAKKIGATVAERALAKGIENVVFDRGGNVYHGRVKALAEGAREGGLKF